MNNRNLLSTGWMIPAIFWTGSIVAGFADGMGWGQWHSTVSHLGALGQPASTLMSAVCMVCALLSLFFVKGVFDALRAIQAPVLPAFGILVFTLSLGWAGLFPAGTPLHASQGPLLLAMMLFMLAGMICWWALPGMGLLCWASLTGILLLNMIFLRFTLPGSHYEGLLQRAAHGGWTVWFLALYWQLQKRTI